MHFACRNRGLVLCKIADYTWFCRMFALCDVIAALGISFTPDVFARRAEWLIAQVVRSANYARAELYLSHVHVDHP